MRGRIEIDRDVKWLSIGPEDHYNFNRNVILS